MFHCCIHNNNNFFLRVLLKRLFLELVFKFDTASPAFSTLGGEN